MYLRLKISRAHLLNMLHFRGLSPINLLIHEMFSAYERFTALGVHCVIFLLQLYPSMFPYKFFFMRVFPLMKIPQKSMRIFLGTNYQVPFALSRLCRPNNVQKKFFPLKWLTLKRLR